MSVLRDSTERVEVSNVDELWAWMNTWGDLDSHDYPARSPEKDGYETAISDMLVRFKEMGVANCSDEAWAKFTNRGAT